MFADSISNHDHDLLRLMSAGNSNAFEALWKKHWEAVYNDAFKRLKDEEQCKDLVQDLFIDLWVRRETVLIDNLKAYLHTAVRYKTYKILSKSDKNIPFFEVFENMATTALGADNVVLEKELADLASKWLDTLPTKRRQIFMMHYGENLSTKEIANRLNISQKTVQNQLGLATSGLNSQLLPIIIMIIKLNKLIP